MQKLLLSKKVATSIFSLFSAGVASYWYLTRAKVPNNVGEMLTSAGFKTLLSDASKVSWDKVLEAYKKAPKSEQLEGVEYDNNENKPTDEVLKEKIIGGCKAIMDSENMDKKNLDLGMAWCVVPTNVKEIVEKNGYKFLDYSGSTDDGKWQNKLQKLKQDKPHKQDVDLSKIKQSCKELAEAPTQNKSFNKAVDVAKSYCSEKS
ncbi:hypothetical protein MHC_04810 [Mycoplasma haemocanis str. Illinois]|uniref:Uncharacterized protein n=1 Tax=Mycoplasma haemocanis (strain Illinois) TaxID=1111676 RepID=H6N846_MYCHN|nr:hypothetical protein [Mycoplasma haemocanis]AEW45818.1 hypothetical protein MHC_04810 [Mycoplasma haemocanis str. Illinois]